MYYLLSMISKINAEFTEKFNVSGDNEDFYIKTQKYPISQLSICLLTKKRRPKLCSLFFKRKVSQVFSIRKILLFC